MVEKKICSIHMEKEPLIANTNIYLHILYNCSVDSKKITKRGRPSNESKRKMAAASGGDQSADTSFNDTDFTPPRKRGRPPKYETIIVDGQ